LSSKARVAIARGAFLTLGIFLGAALVWTLTGAGERGQGVGRAALDTPKDSFTLSGELSRVITPGVFVPLDLGISNSNDAPLVVSELNVTVSAVHAPNATAALPCTAKDFRVRQVDKKFPILVDAKATITLSQLGLPGTSWPQVGMPVNKLTNQNGCKGASITLSYTAVGQVHS
jgi:hypothetical protein